MSDLPKGFYTGPDGRRRFWDGNEWFEPDEETPNRKPANGLKQAFQKLKPQTRKLLAVSLIAASVLGGAAAVGTSVIQGIETANAEEAAAELEEKAAKAEEAAAKAEEADLQERRDNRRDLIKDIERSVKKMARGHAADSFITGPVRSVSCVPTGGVSIDEISIRSMLFECFVSTKKNRDGTSSGYYYNARVDWDEGSYTYGYGRAE
jgi:hypothetical protein